MSEIIGTKEAAKILGISGAGIRYLLRTRRLKGEKINPRKYLIRLEDLSSIEWGRGRREYDLHRKTYRKVEDQCLAKVLCEDQEMVLDLKALQKRIEEMVQKSQSDQPLE